MIARALGVLALVASVGMVTPWTAPRPDGMAATHAVVADPGMRLHHAIELAARHHVPGASDGSWVLHGVRRSDPGLTGREFIVATGAIATAGAPETRVRLSGSYDPASGGLGRVSYHLRPATPESLAEPGWTVQQAVQQAFGEVLPDQPAQFALDSAQSSRAEGGGRRFEGSGIVTFDDGDARFVAFTMTLSARGEMVEFDYSTTTPAQDAEQVAGY